MLYDENEQFDQADYEGYAEHLADQEDEAAWYEAQAAEQAFRHGYEEMTMLLAGGAI